MILWLKYHIRNNIKNKSSRNSSQTQKYTYKKNKKDEINNDAAVDEEENTCDNLSKQ